MATIKIGSRVEKHLPGDYSDGRRGDVIDIKDDRVRVKWDTHPGGLMMNHPIRTWVNIKKLIKIG